VLVDLYLILVMGGGTLLYSAWLISAAIHAGLKDISKEIAATRKELILFSARYLPIEEFLDIEKQRRGTNA